MGTSTADIELHMHFQSEIKTSQLAGVDVSTRTVEELHSNFHAGCKENSAHMMLIDTRDDTK